MTFLLRADNYPQERRSEPKALTHSNPIYVSVNKAGIINRSAPAERAAAVTESCPSLLTPGGYSAGAVAPRFITGILYHITGKNKSDEKTTVLAEPQHIVISLTPIHNILRFCDKNL